MQRRAPDNLEITREVIFHFGITSAVLDTLPLLAIVCFTNVKRLTYTNEMQGRSP